MPGDKGTGNGRARYGKREVLTPLSPHSCCVRSLLIQDGKLFQMLSTRYTVRGKTVQDGKLSALCPKQTCGWPTIQSLLDGTTPVASRIHNPATSSHLSRKESPRATRSKGARDEKPQPHWPKKKPEAPDRPIPSNIPNTAITGW